MILSSQKMVLCSLEHGLKDKGKDGVCLLSPCTYLSSSWSSHWYCPDQGVRTHGRRQWKQLAGTSQTQCFSRFVQALFLEWSNLDWSRATPFSLTLQTLRASTVEFTPKQSKTQGRNKREGEKIQGRVSSLSKDHQARQKVQFQCFYLLKGLW